MANIVRNDLLMLIDNPAGVLACLDGYMNIAMEQTEVSCGGVA